ncbi:phage portal protein [Sphingomonas histidinilytica]|uniref:phage portal protein n=1 Tax=Rhizorhabdus histidinilytica TaxID=439228 RepID=UPI001ADBE49A|nr:phage portal protein [Rhizorhabdus histidinilytica]MBO9377905.1 phage portal protein [Rhizorhabdus histidinilytica]
MSGLSPDDYRRSSGFRRSEPEQRAQTITQNASREQVLAFFGLESVTLPYITPRSALRVPAFNSGVNFLIRTMASLPFEGFRRTKDGPKPLTGRLQTIIRDAPNREWSSWAARRYFWQQVFLYGRGLFAIVRVNGQPYELWPMNVNATRVSMNAWGEKSYTVSMSGSAHPIGKTYAAADVIDVPFMLDADMCNVLSPVQLGEKALQLALAMNDYGSQFFAGGGVPPLSMEGPLPAGAEAMKRAMADVHRAIDTARQSDKPVFGMPPGYKLNQVGYDPAKGQMTDARLFQIQEIARILQLPPVFVQDLSKGTFTNTEQQDLFVVKHVITQWCTALEQEANLKLFGQMKADRYVEHDVDELQRGDFLSRLQGLGQGVQNALISPDEGREVLGRAPKGGNADKLFMQGATVPIDAMGTESDTNGDNGDGDPASQD